MPAETPLADRPVGADSYDGASAALLARRLGVPAVALYAQVASTMDVAHELGAAGAPAGSLVLADAQTAGRGRHGSAWRSGRGLGIWMTLLERVPDADVVGVLSLRVGVASAIALDPFVGATVQLKWPNDLLVGGAKLAGVLVEVRWRASRPDWVAIGVGVNVVAPPAVPNAAGLRPGVARPDVLESLVPAVRSAARRTGLLDARELAEYYGRDFARARRCVRPSVGVVAGVTAAGELAVETPAGVEYHRSGSLVLEGGA